MPFQNRSTLAYPSTSALPVQTWLDKRNPTSNDWRNFEIGQPWVNEVGQTIWFMVGRTATSGTWIEVGSASDLTFNANTGSASPSDDVLNLFAASISAGVTPITTTASGNTLTTLVQTSQAIASSNAFNIGLAAFNSADFTVDANGFVSLTGAGATYFSLTPYIVGPDVHSQYATIAAAIAAAVSAGASSTSPANIYIKPQSGGYTENPILQDGINLIGFNGPSLVSGTNIGPQIHGKLTFTGSGTASVIGMGLNTNSDYLLEITGSNAVVVNLMNCFLNASNSNAIHLTNSNGSIYLSNCTGQCSTNTFFIATAGGINVDDCTLAGNNTTTNSTFASSSLNMQNTLTSFPITTSGTGAFSAIFCQLLVANTLALTHGGSGSSYMKSCRVESGTASCISIGAGAILPITHSEFNSTNTNVITGTGTMKYALLAFTGTSSTTNVTTQTPFATLI